MKQTGLLFTPENYDKTARGEKTSLGVVVQENQCVRSRALTFTRGGVSCLLY
jgi:hypothetical protein